MPKYSYRCTECTEEIEHYHSMNEVLVDCPACDAPGAMIKLPSKFSSFREKQDDKKVGDLVQEAIKENFEELQSQKQELRNNFYEPNE